MARKKKRNIDGIADEAPANAKAAPQQGSELEKKIGNSINKNTQSPFNEGSELEKKTNKVMEKPGMTGSKNKGKGKGKGKAKGRKW